MSSTSRYRVEIHKDRTGVSTLAVLLVLFIVGMGGIVYLGYEQSLIPSAKISITLGNQCTPVAFKVTNTDNKVLRVWSVNLAATPSGSGIAWSPSSESVGVLGPQGQYSGSFAMSFAGAPPGTYKFTATLVNGSQTIATSNSLSCTVK